MRKRIYDYDIRDKYINININFSFPLWFDNTEVKISVNSNINPTFPNYQYSIISKKWIIEEIIFDPEDKIKIERIIKEIFNILENNLFLIENNPIELKRKNMNNEYRIILEKSEIRKNRFNYTIMVEVYENDSIIFEMNLLFYDDKNMSNFNKTLKTLKSFLTIKNLNIIKKAIKDAIKNIVMEDIENLT